MQEPKYGIISALAPIFLGTIYINYEEADFDVWLLRNQSPENEILLARSETSSLYVSLVQDAWGHSLFLTVEFSLLAKNAYEKMIITKEEFDSISHHLGFAGDVNATC